MTPILIKAFHTATAVGGNLIVAASANAEVLPGASATDLLIGVSDAMGADAGGVLDTVQAGWGELKLGGTVAFGDPLTSDANGAGVKAVPAAGSLIRTAAYAMSDGDDGDIIPVLVAPGIINTPV